MRATVLAPDYKVDIIEIGHQMNVAGLPKEFIASAVSTAFEFEGAYDLIRMWADEEILQKEKKSSQTFRR